MALNDQGEYEGKIVEDSVQSAVCAADGILADDWKRPDLIGAVFILRAGIGVRHKAVVQIVRGIQVEGVVDEDERRCLLFGKHWQCLLRPDIVLVFQRLSAIRYG